MKNNNLAPNFNPLCVCVFMFANKRKLSSFFGLIFILYIPLPSVVHLNSNTIRTQNPHIDDDDDDEDDGQPHTHTIYGEKRETS